MARYNENNKKMTQLVLLALVTAVISAFSVFALFKWIQIPVLGPKSASAPSPTEQALTVQHDTTPALKSTDLETLVAPVALYPDLLLAQLLPAATYPLEVAQAARWLGSKPDPVQTSGQDWAPNIAVLLHFPQVIFMLNDRLDWTTELGDRFLVKPDSVLAAIQSIRAKAMAAGLLKDSPEQKVTNAVVTKVSMENRQDPETGTYVTAGSKAAQTRQIELIRIEPANPQVIYVPQYNPQVLYKALPAEAHYPDASLTPTYNATSSQASPWVTYGAGVATGALLGWAISEWNDDMWDDKRNVYYRQPYISRYSGNYNGYHVGVKNINIYISGNKTNGKYNNTLIQPGTIPWIHDPLHRHGYRYPPEAQQRLITPKHQPALAGQRRVTGRTDNSYYSGYNQDQLNRVQKRTHVRTFSEVLRNKKTAKESQRANIDQSTQQAEHLSTAKSGETCKVMPRSAPASDRTVEKASFTACSSEANSIFSGILDGSQTRTYSKRGQTSRSEERLGSSRDGRKRK